MSDLAKFINFWRTHPEKRTRIRKVLNRLYDEEPAGRRRKRRGRGPDKPKVAQVSGADVTLVGLGEACRRLGLSKKTMRNYEIDDVLPRCWAQDKAGRRWYPLAFIEFLRPILREQASKRDPRWKVRDRVKRAWLEVRDSMPIIGQEDIDDARPSAGAAAGADVAGCNDGADNGLCAANNEEGQAAGGSHRRRSRGDRCP